MNGSYTGVLVEVKTSPGRPWRGVVKVDGVLEAAAYETMRGVRQRSGFRPGDEIEVGGINIQLSGLDGTSYLEALTDDLAKLERWASEGRAKDHHWIIRAIDCRKRQIKGERLGERI